MPLTKSSAELDAPAEVAQNAVREGTTLDVSDSYDTTLAIYTALCNTTAHTGTRVRVQVSHNASGDEDWSPLTEFIACVGTANSEVITNNPATAGTTVFTVADTTGYTADGILNVFLEDVSTFANSEWLLMVSHVSNTSITMQDGSTREHAQNSIFYNVAQVNFISVPFGVQRVRVIYDNTYDSDGATVATRCVRTKVTAVA